MCTAMSLLEKVRVWGVETVATLDQLLVQGGHADVGHTSIEKFSVHAMINPPTPYPNPTSSTHGGTPSTAPPFPAPHLA